MVLSRSEGKELNSKSVLIGKWTNERGLNKPGEPAGTRIQRKSKEIEAISGSLAFLNSFFLKTALDFHLRQFVGKWYYLLKSDVTDSEWMISEGQCSVPRQHLGNPQALLCV